MHLNKTKKSKKNQVSLEDIHGYFISYILAALVWILVALLLS